MTDHTNLPPRAQCLLDRIRAEGGEWQASYAAIAAACGLARSTAQLAVADLLDAGLIEQGASVPRHGTLYRLVPTTPTDLVPTRTDSTVPTRTDPILSDAPEHAPAPAHERAQFPLPTPIEPSTATRTERTPHASAPAHEALGTSLVGTVEPTSAGAVPIGQAVVAAAMGAARSAGRSIDARTRGRIGQTAQRLAAEHDVATLLAAARRVGAGGYADLATAVDRISAEPPPPDAAALMPTGETVKTSSSVGAVIEYVHGTWPHSRVDAAQWEAELGKIPERFLMEAIRDLARTGREHAPSWGLVYREARAITVRVQRAERVMREIAEDKARALAVTAETGVPHPWPGYRR